MDGYVERNVCATCLSGDRRLSELGGLRHVYAALVDCDGCVSLAVCWECKAALRRSAQFRLRAARAQAWFLSARQSPESSGDFGDDVKSSSSLHIVGPTTVVEISSTFALAEEASDIGKSEYHSSPEHDCDYINDPYIDYDKTVKNDDKTKEEHDVEANLHYESIENESKDKHQNNVTKNTKNVLEKIKKTRKQFVIFKASNNDDKRKRNEMKREKTIVTSAASKLQKLTRKSSVKKPSGTNGRKGRPRSTTSLIRLNENDMLRYRKQELERESFRSAKYKCDICIMTLCKTNYNRHMNTAHGLESYKYTCHICEVRFKNKKVLVRHIQDHYNLYACLKCSFRSTSRWRMRYHHDRVHTLQMMYQCTTCSTKFTQWSELREHLKEHKKKDNYYQCDKCGKNFKSRLKIEKHMRTHEPYPCTACSHTSKSKYNLSSHYKRKHAVAPVPSEVFCVECDKQFLTSLAYASHLVSVHSDKQREKVVCPACGKRLSDKIALRNHYNRIHLGKTKFHCEKCDKYFYSKSGLNGHITRVHEHIPIPKTQVCNICDRAFSTRRILTHHIRTHTGERPHQCDYCSAAFAQKSAMKNHIKNVHLQKH